LLIAAAAFLRTIADPLPLLRDPDTYMHIAAGRWMIMHRTLPIHDPFSHSMAGAIWIPHEWLAEVIMAEVHGLAGWWGLASMTAALFALAMGLQARQLLRHGEPLTTAMLSFATIALLLPHLLARPHLLALPVMVTWTAALFAGRDAGRTPSLWVIPLMALWANLHGSYMFGIALAAFLAGEAVLLPAERGRRREAAGWAMFLALSVAAALVTPLGVAGFLQPWRMIAMPAMQASVGEWLSPDFASFQPLEIWLLGAIFLGFGTGARLPLLRIVLLLGLFHLALQHSRHGDLLAVTGPFAIIASLGPQMAALIRRDPSSALAGLMARMAKPAGTPAVAAVICVMAVAALASGLRPLRIEQGDWAPTAALASARQLGLSGPVFNTESFGGYLVFSGVPTFIDGRFEMYGNDFLRRYLMASHGQEPQLSQVLDGYGIQWTLLSPDEGAVAAMDRRPGWRRVYADAFAVIHRRTAQASP